MKDLALRSPVSLAVALNATTPVPPTGQRPIIWSTTTSSYLGWNGSNWVAIAGAGGSSPDERVAVDWYIDEHSASLVFTHAGLLINFSHVIFDTVDAPTTGELVYLRSTAFPADEGVYVIGSTASLGAVPLTRHSDWPDTRVIQSGLEVRAARGVQHNKVYAAANLDNVTNDSSLIYNFPLDVAQYYNIASFLGSWIRFSNASGSLTAPLALNTLYSLQEGTYSNSFGLKAAKADVSNITLTTPGTGGIDFEIFGCFGSTAIRFVLAGDMTADDYAINRTFRFVDLTSPSNVLEARSFNFDLGDSSVAVGGIPGEALGEGAVSVGGVAVGSGAYGFFGVAVGENSYAESGVALGEGSAYRPSYYATNTINWLVNHGAAIGGHSRGGFSSGYGVFNRKHLAPSFSQHILLSALPLLESGNRSNVFIKRALGFGATSTGVTDVLEFSEGPTFLDQAAVTVVFKGSIQIRDGFSSDWATLSVEGAFCQSAANPSIKWKITAKTPTMKVSGLSVALTLDSVDYGDGLTMTPVFTVTQDTAAGECAWFADLEFFSSDEYDYFGYGLDPLKSMQWVPTDSITVTTSEALTAGNMVNLHSSSGAKCRKADANPAYSADGFVLADYASGAEATVYISGENPLLTGLTVGPLYLSATAGGVTSTPPGTGNLVQRVGFALSATKMVFQRETPIQT